MRQTSLVIASAVSGLLLLTTATYSPIAEAAKSNSKEKCYGVSKAGHNDCATKTTSCAGSAKKDNQTDAFVMVPKGLCDRLVSGNKKSS